jgi:hypothetical protein
MPSRSDEHRGSSMEMGGLPIDMGKNGITHQEIFYNKESDTVYIGERPGKDWELIGWVES